MTRDEIIAARRRATASDPSLGQTAPGFLLGDRALRELAYARRDAVEAIGRAGPRWRLMRSLDFGLALRRAHDTRRAATNAGGAQWHGYNALERRIRAESHLRMLASVERIRRLMGLPR